MYGESGTFDRFQDGFKSEPAFSLGAAMAAALRWLNEGWGYEVTGMDVVEAYELALAAAGISHINKKTI